MVGLIAAAYMVFAISRRLHPATASRVLLLLATAASAAYVAVVAVLAGAYLVQLAPLLDTSGHVAILLAAHGPVPSAVGLGAVITVVLMSASILVTLGRSVKAWRWSPRDEGIVVVEDPGMAAWAASSRHATVVVSSGMVDRLPPRELAVVFAHEASHLRNHHVRYALLATVASSIAPWFRPIERRIQFLLERWADEDAASVVGDRELVARAIARVALAQSEVPGALGFGGGDVVERVKAMLAPAPARPMVTERIAFVSTTAAASGMAGSSLQLHHAFPHLG